MLILSGNNLGERHRDLNMRVIEAAEKNTNFDEVKAQEEKCDVDVLFKIDLASKYRNIHYILEVLKSGDVFHITRALKCSWIYEDQYSQYLSPLYLKEHIFPHMSTKMEKKLLTFTSMYVRNTERVKDFYLYCESEKLTEHAYKFLVFTDDDYKLEFIRKSSEFTQSLRIFNNSKYVIQFFGNSFELALAYIRFCDSKKYIIHELRYLYFISNENFLNILEEFECNSSYNPNSLYRLGIRISKDILLNHKHRVLKYPVLYVNKLNKDMLKKYLTLEDIKSLAVALAPSNPSYFWNIDYYRIYNFLLDKIPSNDIFAFVKHVFTSTYPGELFEFSVSFYRAKYYELFTIEDREKWALEQIERDEEWSGVENYIWYRFVSFEKAFSGVKRYIFLTPDKDKRSQIVNILPETARNLNDTMKILSYYYQRHVNESEEHKESFINKLIEHNDIYSFDNECWTILDKLFYSLDLYTSAGYVRQHYKARALIYYILHDKELPDGLIEFISYGSNLYSVTDIIDELSTERNAVVAKYLINFYTEKFKKLLESRDAKDESHEDVTNETIENDEYLIQSEIDSVWHIIYIFKRDRAECPEVVLQYMLSKMEIYQYHENFKPKFIMKTEEDFVRWIKKDVNEAVKGIDEIRCNTYRWNFRLCRLFRKLNVYFPDVGKIYLEYFQEYLSDIPKGRREYRNVKMAVVGMLYLADKEVKNEFIEKCIPEQSKIDHGTIDNRLLQVQKAICRLGYHSRPPLPLSIYRRYITGDYVHYCLPVFYHYLTNSTSIIKFIESVIDAPLSIQKHGLRLAFVSFKPEILEPLITNAWRKTKNVSLRKLLFETLFNRILNESEEAQIKLYEILKYYTSELNRDDDDYVYSLLVSDEFPDYLKGNFIETAWLSVSKLGEKTLDLSRKTNIIRHMEKHIHLVEREFPRVEIIDGHIHDMLIMKNIKTSYNEHNLQMLIDSKWSLTAKYLLTFANEEEQQENLDLLNTIITESLELWNHIDKHVYTVRKFLYDFIELIKTKDRKELEKCAYMVLVYESILLNLQNSLNTDDIYLMIWELKLLIALRKILLKSNNSDNDTLRIDQICTEFVKNISIIIIELTKEDGFHHCFYQSVANIIHIIGQSLSDFISACSDVVHYAIMIDLTNIYTKETNILALMMLPRDPPRYQGDNHRKVIDNLKKFNNREIRSLLYEKFVISDYRVRKYMKYT